MKRFLLLALLAALLGPALNGQTLLMGYSPPVPHLGQGAAAWADYDMDGKPDLLLCGIDSLGVRRTVLLHNLGNNTLVPALNQVLPQVAGGDAAWADMDGDGDPDLVLTGESAPRQSVTTIFHNQGGVLIPLSTPDLPGLAMGRVAWADLDHDGDQDIFLTGFSESDGFVGMIARNDGNGIFTPIKEPAFVTREWTAAAVADFDADGMPDIAFADKSPIVTEGMRCVVLRNLGGMRFAVVPVAMPGFYGGSIGFADMDGDGDKDLLCAGMNRAPLTAVCKYTAGQFVAVTTGLVAACDGESVWVDFDGDGDPDILSAGRTATGNAMRVYRNTSGNFQLLQGPVGMPALTNCRIAVGDQNFDGHPDFVVTGTDAAGIPQAYIGTWVQTLQQFKF